MSEESYCGGEVLEDGVSSTAFDGSGEDGEDGGGFFVRSMRGKANGVPSNSAQPPLRPISTTLCNIRASSSCLQRPCEQEDIEYTREFLTTLSV